MKKVLISDYYQTFYLNDKDIEENKKVIKRFRELGNIFIIATGRSYMDYKNKVQQYNIEYDYVILNHGTTILDSNNNTIYNCVINNNIIDKLKNDLELNKSVSNFCCSKFESRVNFNCNNLTKIHVRYNDRETAMGISNKINDKYAEYINAYFVTGNAVEIISKETDKSYAISLLLENLKIDKNQVYTIGDGYSDIEMIKDYNGYCMKESVEELKILAKNEFESVSMLVNELMEDSIND